MTIATSERFSLHALDCCEGMETLRDHSIAAVVTSPPYNIGTEYEGPCNDRIPEERYLEWCGEWLCLIREKLETAGSLFLNVGSIPSKPTRAIDVLREALEVGFHLQNTIHWVKAISIQEGSFGHYKPINSSRFLNDCHEYIWHLTLDGNAPLDRLAIGVPYKDKSNIGRYHDQDLRCRGNTWFIPYPTVRERKVHPATFPVALPRLCLALANPGPDSIVLDPFMGTGATGIAAIERSLRFIGFDTSEEYCRIARERIIEAQETVYNLYPRVSAEMRLSGLEGAGDSI